MCSVRNLLRITLAWAALVAWLVASGVTADVLEAVACADHAASGVSWTAKDDCGACHAAHVAREASRHSSPVKHEVAKAKPKADGAVWTVSLPIGELHVVRSFREVSVIGSCPELICEVPVPPPEATV